MNGMTQSKSLPEPDSFGHQPDDNMAFMNYYHLIRYETDPKLLSIFHYAIRGHWQYEQLGENAFTNFVYGACCFLRKKRHDPVKFAKSTWTPTSVLFDDAVDTLKHYPLDLVEWPMSNAHRIDMVRLGNQPKTCRNGSPSRRLCFFDRRAPRDLLGLESVGTHFRRRRANPPSWLSLSACVLPGRCHGSLLGRV